MKDKLTSNYMLFTKNGTECQILGAAITIWFMPVILTQGFKLKIIRFIGVLLLIPCAIILLPILIPLVIAGIIQLLWQIL